LLAVAYAGWVIYSRSSENRELEKAAEQKQGEADAKVLEKLGGSSLKILMFYANPPVVRKGGHGLLCYGVSNAKRVQIEPGVEGTGPSISRCVEVRPSKDTEYTLKASDDKGGEASQSVTVRVQ